MVRAVRGLGWALVASGVVVLLYVVYLLWFTSFEADRSQQQLADAWALRIPDSAIGTVADPQASSTPDDSPTTGDGDRDGDESTEATDDEPEAQPEVGTVEPGEAYAAVWFERDGERIVHDEVLYVVEGVGAEALRSGPGHYPESDRPGGPGNLAIAGHRTTYGSPFWSLDELDEGDTIHVVDLLGREWVYAYRRQQVVSPADVWVVGRDPLDTGAPTVTLTTCHPRGSARQRLIAFGELVGDPLQGTAGEVAPDGLAES